MGGGHVGGFLKMPDAGSSPSDVARVLNAQGAVNQQYGDSKCAAHPDFRELLARPDIDAVVIATGDLASADWHRGGAPKRAKPLSVTLAEGLALREAVQKYGVVFQWGTPALQRQLPAPRSWCGTATSATCAPS
jgi:predicted dehydrogenase